MRFTFSLNAVYVGSEAAQYVLCVWCEGRQMYPGAAKL